MFELYVDRNFYSRVSVPGVAASFDIRQNGFVDVYVGLLSAGKSSLFTSFSLGLLYLFIFIEYIVQHATTKIVPPHWNTL